MKSLVIHIKGKKRLLIFATLLVLGLSAFAGFYNGTGKETSLPAVKDDTPAPEGKTFIKWVEFNIPYAALERALNADIKAHKEGKSLNWIELLALTGTKYSGNWKNYKSKELDEIAKKMLTGDPSLDTIRSGKYYAYYYEVYDSILHEFVGEYKIEAPDPSDKEKIVMAEKYGLKVFSPVATGYSFSHFKDFGDSRGYGYTRRHLGNDLMGSIGTPIIAIESGTVEEMGWNQYGGWRIGVRSFDRKRYYYYAHLRRNHPFPPGLQKGDNVTAGDVIGYLGMTGYSKTENVNGMQTPHLHLGLQLIFDESQVDGPDEIWIDVYSLVKLLQKNKSSVRRDDSTKDYYRKYRFVTEK